MSVCFGCIYCKRNRIFSIFSKCHSPIVMELWKDNISGKSKPYSCHAWNVNGDCEYFTSEVKK